MAGAARAEGGCPDGSEALRGKDLVEHEPWLAQYKDRCQDDPFFLAWHGAILSQLGRFNEAVAQLERALLLGPELVGAHIDYAEALAASGDRAAARQLLREVETRPDIPPAAADRVRQVLRLINGYMNGFLQETGLTATVRAGYDSNLNRATRLDTLSLTLPTGDLVLPLDAASRARAGAGHLLDLEGYWTRAGQSGKVVRAAAELHHREAAGADLDYTQVDLSVTLDGVASLAAYPIGFAAAAGNLHYGGEEIYRYLRGGVQLARPAGACRNLLGADLEVRRYVQDDDAGYRALVAKSSWVCGRERPLVMQTTLGREIGEENRAGGSAWLLGARLAQVHPLGPGQLEAEFRYAGRRDDDPYSSLLHNGAALRAHAFSFRLEYRYPLGRHWHALADVEAMRQVSNIDLFTLDNVAGHLGVRWRW